MGECNMIVEHKIYENLIITFEDIFKLVTEPTREHHLCDEEPDFNDLGPFYGYPDGVVFKCFFAHELCVTKKHCVNNDIVKNEAVKLDDDHKYLVFTYTR